MRERGKSRFTKNKTMWIKPHNNNIIYIVTIYYTDFAITIIMFQPYWQVTVSCTITYDKCLIKTNCPHAWVQITQLISFLPIWSCMIVVIMPLTTMSSERIPIRCSVWNTVRPDGLPKLPARVRRVQTSGWSTSRPPEAGGLPNLRLGWTVYYQ